MKASFRLRSADTLIKQTYIGQAGKKQFLNLFMTSLKSQVYVLFV